MTITRPVLTVKAPILGPAHLASSDSASTLRPGEAGILEIRPL